MVSGREWIFGIDASDASSPMLLVVRAHDAQTLLSLTRSGLHGTMGT